MKVELSIIFIVNICILSLLDVHSLVISSEDRDYIVEKVENYQTTIDSLMQKNERLNKGFLELYDDRAMMSIEMDKLVRDNKYLKRITR